MAATYDGLTRNTWTGTWSPSGDHPIVLSNEIRGGVQYVSGDAGDQLTDIPGTRIQEGMMVYVKNTYGSVTGDKYYTYSLGIGESRDASTGAVPNAAGNWTEVSLGGSSISVISDIGNVSSTAPNAGQVLKWDGSEWAPAADSGSGAGISLTDISVGPDGTASGGGSLSYNNITGVFTYTPASVPTDLTDLGISDGTSGQFLTTDGAGNFSFATVSGGGGGASAINDLSDVDTVTAAPSAGEALIWDSVNSKWIPGSVSASSISAFDLSDLGDVSNTIIPSTGQVLKWSGTEWAPASDAVSATSGGITLGDLSVTVATNFGQGNLTYNTSTGVFLFTPPDLSGYSTFSGNYADLSGLPTLFSGDYADLTNTPTTSDNIQLSLTGTTTLNLVNGDDNSIIDSVNLNTITSGLSYNDLDDLPNLFSGNYNDLTNKPTIPSLSGYATESYVQTFVAGLSSDNITEGGVNLYYADERVDDRVAVLIDAGTGLSSTYDDAGNLLTIDLDDTAVSPASYGSATQVPVITIDQQGRITAAASATISSDLPVQGDTGIDTISLLTDTLTVAGGTGIETDVATKTATITLSDTTVTPGTYGTQTDIPVLDIDQQGRITGASTTTISTDLAIAGDTGTDAVSLLTDTFTVAGGVGVDTSVASDTVTIDIGQPVGTTDSVTFDEVTVTNNVSVGGDLSVTGDLTVSGTLTSINTTDTEITDNLITLNKGETGAGISSGTSGIEIDRGTESAVSIVYNDTDDQWTFGTETVEAGHILPAAHETYDLGSTTSAWKDLYLSGTSIYLGDLQITSTASGALEIDNGTKLGGEEETQTLTTTNVTVVRKDIVMAARTTDATTTEVFLDDGTSTIDVASGATSKFKATFVATDGTDTAAFSQTGLIHNIGGTTALIGTNITETLAQDSGNDWYATITADDASDYLKIEVTGEASTTIDWTVFLEISEAKR